MYLLSADVSSYTHHPVPPHAVYDDAETCIVQPSFTTFVPGATCHATKNSISSFIKDETMSSNASSRIVISLSNLLFLPLGDQVCAPIGVPPGLSPLPPAGSSRDKQSTFVDNFSQSELHKYVTSSIYGGVDMRGL